MFSFSWLTALVRNFYKKLAVVRGDIFSPQIVSNIWGKDFSFFSLMIILTVHILDVLSQVEKIPSIFSVLSVFKHEVCWSLSNLYQIGIIMVFYSLLNVDYVNWLMFTSWNRLHPWNKSHMAVIDNFLIYFWIWLTLCWKYLHLCSSEIVFIVLLSCMVFIWFMCWPQNKLQGVISASIFLKLL